MANKKNIVIKVKYPTHGRRSDANDIPAHLETEWNIKRIVVALAALLLTASVLLYYGFSEHESPNGTAPPSDGTGAAELKHTTGVRQKPNTEAKSEPSPTENGTEAGQPLQFKLSEADKVISSQTIEQIKENIKEDKTETVTQDTAQKQAVALNNKSEKKGRSQYVARALLTRNIINKEPVGIINSPIKVSKSRTVWINYFTELKNLNKRTVYHEWIKDGRIDYKLRIKISANRWRASSRKPFNHTAAGSWQVRTVDEKGRLLDRQEFRIVLER
ncbi:MAG: DUF2914 domain-containing protein [Gammaproteobacteria bacterium]